MFTPNTHPKNIFAEGYQSFNRTVLYFGIALVTLAVLIFVYPALIGILFATFILLAGSTVLAAAYRMYRFKKHLESFEKEPRPIFGTLRTEGPRYTHRRFTWIIR